MTPKEEDKVRYVSHDDEIDYANLLKKRADKCFEATGYPLREKDTTISFKRALMFEAQGLHFKKRILKYEKQLNIDLEEEKTNFKNKFKDREFYKNINQAALKRHLHEWYWGQLLEFLLGLLAEHRALMKAKDYVEEGEELKSSSAE